MVNLAIVINYLRPDLAPLVDYVVSEDRGEQTVEWITTSVMPPTEAEIAAASDAANQAWLAQIKAKLAAKVDDYIGGIFLRFTRFQMEYEGREKAAREYRDAGYAGDEFPSIRTFAEGRGIAYREAVDLVLLQADALRAAVDPLGEVRMQKYRIDNAATAEEAEQICKDIIVQATSLVSGL